MVSDTCPWVSFFSSEVQLLGCCFFLLLFLLGRTKLRFLSLGINVIEEWIEDSKNESAEVHIYNMGVIFRCDETHTYCHVDCKAFCF